MSSDDCCTTAFRWNGVPTGHEAKLGENLTYIAGTSTKAAVLFIHDAFGWKMNNNRLLADHFAQEAKVTVYLVDFFGGAEIDEDKLVAAWTDPEIAKAIDLNGLFARNSKAIRGPEMFACAKILKEKYEKVGTIGYCWGAWGCVQIGAKDQNLVNCVSIAHPSLTEKEEFGGLAVPTQIIAPEHDHRLTQEVKEYCNRVIPGNGVPYMYDYYPGLEHGFATKGDQRDEAQRKGLERAKDSVVFWLKLWLH